MDQALVASDDVRLRDVRLRICNNLQLISAVVRLRRRQGVTREIQEELLYLERLLRFVAKKCEANGSERPHANDADTRLRALWSQLEGNFDLLLSVLLVREKQQADRSVRAELRRMQHLVSIVAELQENPRSEEPRDFAAYLDGVVTLWNKLAWENGITIRSDRVESLYLCSKLATLLGVATFETLSNSVEHAFPRGEQGQVTIGLQRNSGHTASLRISDDGIGFHVPGEEDCESGLAIVRRLVKSIGGAICIHSRAGHGTETTIRFPLVSKKEYHFDGRQ